MNSHKMTNNQENFPNKSIEDESIPQSPSHLRRQFEEDIKRVRDLDENDYDICYKENRNQLREAFQQLYLEQEQEGHNEDLNTTLFEKLHDNFFCYMKKRYLTEDAQIFHKSKFLNDLNVSAEQFGADENHSITLSAAVVELSIIDIYKSPIEKMKCLCTTYDLVFAELKTALVSDISKNSVIDCEIPIINNSEVIPVLIAVIIKSRIAYFFSTILYVRSFYHNLENDAIMWPIYIAFCRAVWELKRFDIKNMPTVKGKIRQSMDLEEFMKLTMVEANDIKTLVDQENDRALRLISRSTNEDLG